MSNFPLLKNTIFKIKLVFALFILFTAVTGFVNKAAAMCDPVGDPCEVLECGPDCAGDRCQYCYSKGTCVENEDGTTGCDIEDDCNAHEENCKSGCPCLGPPDDGCDEKDPNAPGCGVSPNNGAVLKSYDVTFEWSATTDWGEGCPNKNKYKVYLREAGSGTWDGTKVCEAVEGTTTCPVSGLEQGESYEWKVRADNGPREADSGTCSFSVADDTVAPTGDLDVPEKVCPFLDSEVTTAFSGDTYPNVAKLFASNIIDHPGDDAWGTADIRYYIVMDDNGDEPNGIGDDVEGAGWGPFDWKPSKDADHGIYYIGRTEVDPPAKGPIYDSITWSSDTTFNGYSRDLRDLNLGSTYSVALRLEDAAENPNGWADGGRMEIACPGFVYGYVWEENFGEAVDGVQTGGEPISSAATVTLEKEGSAEQVSLSPGGFDVAVEPGYSYGIYTTADSCYCPTADCSDLFWNNPPPNGYADPVKDPSNTGNAESYDSSGLSGTPYSDLGSISQLERHYAYLGIQESGFSISGPDSILIDPELGGETQGITASVRRKHDYCWSPINDRVQISVDPVSDDEEVSVSSIDPNPVSLNDDDSKAVRITFAATEEAVGGVYKFEICGESSCSSKPECFATDISVESLAWFQSEGGDIYARAGLTSPIPEKTRAFRDDDYDDDYPEYPKTKFISNDRSSPGFVFGSGMGINYGSFGEVSSKDWEADAYPELGFYDEGIGYLYNYQYFANKLKADCVFDEGKLERIRSCLASGQVARVTGDLTVTGHSGFAGKRGAILVDGDIVFEEDFEPNNGHYAFISSGSIRFASAVENVRGVFLADGAIYDYGEDDSSDDYHNQENGLLVKGSACSLRRDGDSFGLRRTRGEGAGADDTLEDDLEPANYFAYDPEFLFELASELGEYRYTWREQN